jgi:glycerol kinase
MTPRVIRADGGLVANKFVCQFLADMLNRPVEIPAVTETTALGAAYLAGMGAGIYSGLSDISAAWMRAQRFEPKMTSAQRDALYQGWKNSLHSLYP